MEVAKLTRGGFLIDRVVQCALSVAKAPTKGNAQALRTARATLEGHMELLETRCGLDRPHSVGGVRRQRKGWSVQRVRETGRWQLRITEPGHRRHVGYYDHRLEGEQEGRRIVSEIRVRDG